MFRIAEIPVQRTTLFVFYSLIQLVGIITFAYCGMNEKQLAQNIYSANLVTWPTHPQTLHVFVVPN